MPRRPIWLLVPVFLLSAWACEKDDICVDAGTPLLIVRFYDSQDTTVLKPAAGLRVVGLGQETAVPTFADRTARDSIGIPLRNDAAETGFVFILNSADDEGLETGNRDTLRFNYQTREFFVSRACGYAVAYDSLQAAATASDPLPWVEQIVIRKPSVQNQTTAHVAIYH